MAITAAFLNPPSDPAAASRLAQALVASELVAAGALLVSFAGRLGFRDAAGGQDADIVIPRQPDAEN